MNLMPMDKTIETKASSLEWVDSIPSAWEVKRLKWSVLGCQNGIWGADPDGVSDLVVVRVADFDRLLRRVSLSQPTRRAVKTSEREGRLLKRGDLLLEKSGGGEKQPVGMVVIFDHDEEAVCSNFVAKMTAADGHHPEYLNFLHHAFYDSGLHIKSVKQSTGIQNLDSHSYLDEHAPFPPFDEQVLIAEWLRKATSRIDTLIAKKTRFIELLKEKRQAVITKAVTKGLDDSVEMKDSGMEWLGKVPMHWTIKRLRFDISTNPSSKELGLISADLSTAFLPMDAIGENGEIDRSRRRPFFELQSGYSYFKDGDVIIAKVTPCFENGKGAVVSEMENGFAFGTTELIVLRPSESLLPEFLYLITRSYPVRNLGVQSMSGASGLKRVPDDFFRNLPWPTPSVSEQATIIEYVGVQLARLDRLMEKTHRSIELLKEKRSALITAAVTGKIDVREAA